MKSSRALPAPSPLLRAALLAAAALLAPGVPGVPHAAAVVPVNAPRTVTELSGPDFGWDGHLDTLYFDQPAASLNPADITAVLIFSAPANFSAAANTEQRLNLVAGRAGAFRLGSTTAVVIENNINTAAGPNLGKGGALFLADGSLFAVQQSAAPPANSTASLTFRSNTAAAGGAIYTNNAAALALPLAVNVNFTDNHASDGSGGAIYAHNSLALQNAANLLFTGNSARSDGGAIYGQRDISLASNASFDANHATASGGAVYADRDFSAGNNTVFTANTADVNGGALIAAGTVSLGTSAHFSANTATIGQGDGGAIHSSGDIALGASAYFNANSAKSGGAIFLNNNAPATITLGAGAQFIGNKALGSGSGGGAIYSKDALILANSGSTLFASNTTGSEGGGGAIYANNALTIAFAAEFNANTTQNSGGAIRANGTVSLAANTVFTANSAAHDGGALFLANNALTLGAGTVFTGNSAASSGGAIATNAALTIAHGALAFTANTATDGGAIATAGPLVLGANVNFTANSAANSGGAIAATGTVSLAANTVFIGNSADTGPGGAIAATSTVSLSGNTLFKNNTTAATHGGAIAATALLLNADAGDILFTGNTGNTAASAAPSAAALSGGTSTFTSAAARAIVFDDPLHYATAATANSIVSTAALVQFAGVSTLNAPTTVGGSLQFNAGTLRLVAGAVLDAGGAAFNAATATTVAGTGTLASTAPGAPIRIAGIVAPDSFRYIADANLTNPGSLAGTEIGTLTLDGNADLSGATIQLRINPAPAASDRLVVLGNLTLNAATTLEITGTIAAATGEYSGPGSAVLISTTGGVSGFNTAKVNVPDSIARAENYLANGVSLDASGLNIVIQTSLAWYATDLAAAPIDRRAHGTFTLADGKTFTVNVPLNDHTNNLSDAWRQQNAAGRVLTKLGTGTLVLARDGGYTGGTTVSEGLLRLTTPAAAGTGAIAVSPGATLELAFSGNFANAVSGNGTINIAAAANVAATATLTGADFANHGAFTGPALDFTALLTNHGTLEAATVGGTTASFVNDSAASVTGNGAYSLAALTNRGSFAASTVNARDSITNHGTFTATDVAGAIVNGDDAATPDAPSAPRFTASGSVTGAILNRGIFRALHVNTPAGFDLATPLILNHGAFDATGGTVTGTIENTGTANVGSVNTPGGGLPATINLVRNTGTFTATTVNGSVLNGLAPNANAANDADADAPANPGATAVFTADAVSGTIENHASFTAAIVNGNVTNTGTFNASNVTGDITNSGTFGNPAATDNSGTTINGLVDNAANGLLNAGVINLPADGLPESRTWLVENHGALTASAVKGALFNAASGEASIGDVDGAVRNAGNIQLRNNAATWGALDNAGGTIRFLDPPQPLVLFDATDGAPPHARAGRTLNIAALTAGNGADRGTYEMSVNISDLAASDRLNVAGEITGAHHFNLTVSTSDPEANLDRAPVVIAIHNSSLRDENVTADVASPYANILHEYAFMSDDNGGYMLAETSKYGPGPTVIGNTIGAMSLSWFAQLNNIERRLGDLRLNAGMIFPIVSRRYTLADANGDEVGGASSARNQNASSGNGDGTDGSGRYNDGRDDVGNNVRTAGLHGVRPPHPLGIWTRAHAQQANVDLGITGMQRFREFQYGVDVGADREFSSGSRHLFYAGAFAGYLGATRDFRDAYGSDGGTDSVAFGVYGAWLHASGLFFEADAKGQYFMTEYNAARDDHAEFESTGAGLSFRLGYRWSLASSFYLEGDIAFSYVHLFNEDFTTANRLRVNVGDSDIRVFGANLRFGKVFDLAHLGFLQPFVKAVIEGQVSNTDGVTIESMRLLRLRPDTDGTRGSVGFGGAWQLDARQQIHFDYEFVWGDKYVKPWTLSLGYRRLF